MNIPLTSLSWMEWAVWADFCGDSERWVAEKYARKVSKSLQKMDVMGVDPRCCLVFNVQYPAHTDVRVYSWQMIQRAHPKQAPVVLGDFDRRWWSPLDLGYVTRTGPFWMSIRMTNKLFHQLGMNCVPEVFGPADLYEPERQTKLIFKFWRSVVRRATGIPDHVLSAVG